MKNILVELTKTVRVNKSEVNALNFYIEHIQPITKYFRDNNMKLPLSISENNVKCPFCKSEEVFYWPKYKVYECFDCGKQFTIDEVNKI